MSSPAARGPSSAQRAIGRPGATPGRGGNRVRFQLPRSAYLAVLFLGLGITPFVRSPILIVLYVVPVLAAVFVARRASVVDDQKVSVRTLLGAYQMRWDEVRGVLIRPRGSIVLVDRGGRSLRLPYVRDHHLQLLAELSGGRLPGPGANDPGANDPGATGPDAG